MHRTHGSKADARFSRDALQVGTDPTAHTALKNITDQEPGSRKVRPMSIERLIAAGGTLSLVDEARVLYHQLGDLEAVALRLKRPVYWVRLACEWDIEQRRIQSAS